VWQVLLKEWWVVTRRLIDIESLADFDAHIGKTRHEPTNVFATEIAKYFFNALREDTLLHHCEGGVVYLPGQAGTVQEIFQAVTENFYAADASLVVPLILVGREYWTDVYPAWPLLQRLGAGRAMGELIYCVDGVKEAADLLTAGLNAAGSRK